MKDLKEKVQAMLDGEKKRREIALKWLSEVEEILLPVAEDIWGNGDTWAGGMFTGTRSLTKKNKDGNIKETEIYFRFKNFEGTNDIEYTGFYDGSECEMNTWGKLIEDLRGKEFWYAIQIIIDWIPQVIEIMDKRQISREQLLSKLQIIS